MSLSGSHKQRDVLLVIFLITIQFFRVDFSAGILGFNLTPGLLSGILILIYVALNGLRIESIQIKYLIFLAIIASYFSLRILAIEDVLQLKRTILFVFALFTSLFTLNSLIQSNDPEWLIRKVIVLSLIIYLTISVLHVYLFIVGEYYNYGTEPLPFVRILPRTIGPFWPRLTAGFTDPNVCGYYFSFLYYLTFFVSKGAKYRWMLFLVVVLTLSRSAIAALLLGILFFNLLSLFESRVYSLRFRFSKILYYLIIMMAFAFIVFLTYDFINDFVIVALNARLNDEGSTNIHLGLFDLALNELSTDSITLIFGKGFSTSFLYTDDFFGDLKYGNFHSEYITLIFETGLIGLSIYLLFFLVPVIQVIKYKTFREVKLVCSIIVTILLQNIFYQQFLFFYYWAFIAIIWWLSFKKKSQFIINK